MSRAVVFTPIKFQGLGVKHPYDTQGIYKIEALLNQPNTLTNQLLEATWQRTMQESGFGPNFLEKDGTKIIKVLTKGWMTSLWEFLIRNNLKLRRKDSKYVRTPRNKDDSYLMEDICQVKLWSAEEMRKFNYCRLYLGVELLSDIITADGKAIRKRLWSGVIDVTHDHFVKLYYAQTRPGETAWSLWRKMLKITYQCEDNGKFQIKKSEIETTFDWVWFYHQSSDRLYRKTQEGWEVRSRLPQRRNTRQGEYGYPHLTSEIVEGKIPVTVYAMGEKIQIEGRGKMATAIIHSEALWTDSVSYKVNGSIQLLDTLFKTQRILIMSDASVRDGLATAAWIITTEEGFSQGSYIQGTGIIPSNECDSHRAELYGILGGYIRGKHIDTYGTWVQDKRFC
jgi:hypothetical protein